MISLLKIDLSINHQINKVLRTSKETSIHPQKVKSTVISGRHSNIILKHATPFHKKILNFLFKSSIASDITNSSIK